MTASTVKQRTIAGGKIYFDVFTAAGAKTGERYLGNTPGFTVSLASQKIESYQSEDGIRQLDDSALVSITRTGKLTCRQASLENMAAFIIGDISSQTQTGAGVTGEAISVLPDRYYQLGATVANPSGVRGPITACTCAAGAAAVSWGTGAAKVVGDLVKKASNPTVYHICTVAGTTGTPEPTWPTTPGATITDGSTIVWECVGLLTPLVTVDFTVADDGRIYVLPGKVSPRYASTYVLAYTKPTKTRDRVTASGLAQVTGALRLVATNARGDNRDWYAPNVLLAPSGDLVLKSDDPKYMEMSWDVSFFAGTNGEPALVIDGQPV